MSSSSLVTTSLEYALNRVAVEFKDMTDGQEMIDKITIKFEHTCNNPPTKDFEFLLRKPFTDDEVCVALFKPRDEQVEYFAALLVAIQSLPGNHPTQKLAPLLVSLLFLVHRYERTPNSLQLTMMLIFAYCEKDSGVLILIGVFICIKCMQERLGIYEDIHLLQWSGFTNWLY